MSDQAKVASGSTRIVVQMRRAPFDLRDGCVSQIGMLLCRRAFR